MSTSLPSNKNNNTKNSRESKRKRDSPEPAEVIQTQKIQKVKISKAYKMSLDDFSELKKLITETKNGIENRINDSQTSIESKLNEFTTSVKAEVQTIKNSVEQFKTAVGTDIVSIRSRIQENSKRIDNTEDDINRLKLANDLRLIGFPYIQNENLFDLFAKIATIIGYDTTLHISVPIIERVPIHNKATGTLMPSSTILFHFTSSQIKQHFYTLYLNKMPLKPEQFGLPQGNRIVLGENLTQKNAFLFKKAQIMRINKKIAQVFTVDGLVKIKFNKGTNHTSHTIHNTLELEVLVAQQQSMETEELNNSPLPITGMPQQQFNASFEMLPNEPNTHTTAIATNSNMTST